MMAIQAMPETTIGTKAMSGTTLEIEARLKTHTNTVPARKNTTLASKKIQ